MCNRFLWSGDIQKCCAAKVSWQSCCLPKTEGGLGLRDFGVWNKTLNLKFIWLLFASTTSLAGQLLSCRVGDGSRISFWYDNWSIHGPLFRFIGTNGPLLMRIQDHYSVADTLLVRDWQAPSRSRNQNISLLRET